MTPATADLAPEADWARDVAGRLGQELAAAADPTKAAGMRSYMRDQFAFLGVATPARRAVLRRVLTDAGTPSPADPLAAAHLLWHGPAREHVYAAGDLLGAFRRTLPPDCLESDLRRLLLTQPWWDSVDLLTGQVVRHLLAREPALVEVIWRWSRTQDRWLVRVALTHQLRAGAATDVDRLFALCVEHEADREFFVAKAVGWALRDYAWTDPDAVTAFVASRPGLSALARREALKNVARRPG